jgi:hypothetical protein
MSRLSARVLERMYLKSRRLFMTWEQCRGEKAAVVGAETAHGVYTGMHFAVLFTLDACADSISLSN